jgi:predicted dehydrogenase
MNTNGNRVRWGTLGCARVFERRMVPGFAAAGDSAELLAVASRSEEKAEATATKHGVPRAYGSYDALLNDSEIEAVYIPLPNDQHAEWTLRALDAGKHVLCDKPAALTYADARRMEDAARAASLRLMEGFMWRHHPQHARIAEIRAAGEIGELIHFRGIFTYSATPDPVNLRWKPEHGGGALLDVAVYPVNAARAYFGGEPVSVYAASFVEPSSGVDRHTSGLLEFADGRNAYFIGGFDQPFLSRYEIVGSGGSITAERAFQIGEKGVNVVVRVGDDERTEFFPHADQYGLEIEHFSACVRDPDAPLSPGEDGVAQARVVEALRRSAAEKRRVEINEIGA